MPRRRKVRERSGAAGGLRAKLRKGSRLDEHVRPGIQALEGHDRPHIDEALRPEFHDSLHLDKACAEDSANSRRWDYLLGLKNSQRLVGVEVHPATPGEVSVIVEKKRWAEAEMRAHLLAGQHVARWFWIASGSDRVGRTTSEFRQLSAAGIVLVGSRLRRDNVD